VTENEIEAQLQAIADRNQTSLQEVKNYYEQQNLLSSLRLDLMEKKVRTFLRENAEIVES